MSQVDSNIKAVEELGAKIGYGELMSIASGLWRHSLREKGYPVSGAFIPTCPPFVKEDCLFPETIEGGDKRITNYYNTKNGTK
ncbi:hypothetical protein M1M30_gp148 [Maribacter phage Colly_1]|uniref:Uncharacterized protein n=1 Tax=Maribacter phage Colly_1 TaxID=2745691 RepID=A0A8E4XVN5_9CAUD|nr:hypothetical protein M1M30_gp148 [Maribacter phage Colly_1]QQO97249.1 hypothetical protein Colly1_148 [Maribacter phage Colly_1]